MQMMTENEHKPLEGEVVLRLSVKKVNEINALIDRDAPKAIDRKVMEIAGEDVTFHYCPSCRRIITIDPENKFCRGCGQRLDVETIAL